MIVLIALAFSSIRARSSSMSARRRSSFAYGQINRIVEKPRALFQNSDRRRRGPDRRPHGDVALARTRACRLFDGRRYLVDALTMARIGNSQKFREAVGADLQRARDRIETRPRRALRQTYGKRSFESRSPRIARDDARDPRPGQERSLEHRIDNRRFTHPAHRSMDEVLKNTYER